MAKYECLYKCRLCGQVFVNCGTVSEKVAEQSTLNEVLRASGMSPMWKENDALTMYEMHRCADGSFGVSEFQGTRKAGTTWQELSSVSSNAATADSSLSPTHD